MPGTEGQKPSLEQIALVRAMAKEKFIAGGLEKYSQVDINKLQQDEVVELFWLHCYWLSGEQVDEAVDMIDKTFKWRKEFGVNELSRESVGQKLVESGALTLREERSKNGDKILVFCIRKHIKSSKDLDDMKRSMVLILEDLRVDNCAEVVTLVFDCSGAGIRNIDLDIINFLVGLFQRYYPCMLGNILIFDLPWILTAAYNIIKVGLI